MAPNQSLGGCRQHHTDRKLTFLFNWQIIVTAVASTESSHDVYNYQIGTAKA